MIDFMIKVSIDEDCNLIEQEVYKAINKGVIRELDLSHIAPPSKVVVTDISANISKFRVFLETRISRETSNRVIAQELNIKIAKGGKITSYKEVLNYLKTHILKT